MDTITSDRSRSQWLAEESVRWLRNADQEVLDDGVRFIGKLLHTDGAWAFAADTARSLYDWASDRDGIYNKALDDAGLVEGNGLDVTELNALLERFK